MHKKCHLVILGAVTFLIVYNRYNGTLKSDPKTLRLLAFGDSLTEGLYNWPGSPRVHPYTDMLEQLFRSRHIKVKVKNAGISGSRVADLETRLHDFLSLDSNYHLIMILAGTNDYLDIIKSGEKPSSEILAKTEEIFNNITRLHAICHHMNISTGIMTIPNVKFEKESDHQTYDLLRGSINQKLKIFSEANKDKSVFVDVASHMDMLDKANSSRIWDDNVHFTHYGYDKIGELVFESLQQYIGAK